MAYTHDDCADDTKKGGSLCDYIQFVYRCGEVVIYSKV